MQQSAKPTSSACAKSTATSPSTPSRTARSSISPSARRCCASATSLSRSASRALKTPMTAAAARGTLKRRLRRWISCTKTAFLSAFPSATRARTTRTSRATSFLISSSPRAATLPGTSTTCPSAWAHSTDLEAPESVEHLCGKCKAYAACWRPEAEKLWDEEHCE